LPHNNLASCWYRRRAHQCTHVSPTQALTCLPTSLLLTAKPHSPQKACGVLSISLRSCKQCRCIVTGGNKEVIVNRKVVQFLKAMVTALSSIIMCTLVPEEHAQILALLLNCWNLLFRPEIPVEVSHSSDSVHEWCTPPLHDGCCFSQLWPYQSSTTNYCLMYVSCESAESQFHC